MSKRPPQDAAHYVHRIGRTGRAGRNGTAFSFVVGKEVYKLKEIQRYCKTKIYARPVPSVNDVAATKQEKIFHQVEQLIQEEVLTSMIHMIQDRVNESD